MDEFRNSAYQLGVWVNTSDTTMLSDYSSCRLSRRTGQSAICSRGHYLMAVILIGVSITLLTACSKNTDVTPAGTTGTGSTTATTGTGSVLISNIASATSAPEGSTATAANVEDLLANTTFSSTVTIGMGATATISNPLEGKGVTITQSNGDVVITATATATGVAYVLTGTTTSGSVKIYSDKKFLLTLNGVTITNNDGPAINIQSSKRAFIVLADNTTNSLTDAVTYTASGTEDQKGTLFSEGQLIFSGNGTLNLKGNNKHAICSDDYVRLISGTINISGAASDGIHTNDAFIADGGTITLAAANDGIQCEEGYIVINDGTFTINVADKGIAASYDTDTTIDPYLTINGGVISVTSTAGEGIESKSVLTINKGTVTLRTYDDGINAGTFIYINGGTIYAYSSNNDGIDSNGKLTVTGGQVISAGAGGPEEGFDCDRNTFKITGGVMIGIGGATSTPTASVSSQPSVILGSGAANQLFHIEASDGTETVTFLIPRSYSTMLFSSPNLKTGTTYKVYSGGSVTGGTLSNGLYTSGTYSLGTQAKTFTTSSMVTTSR